jgi:hypothetical protein
MFERLNRKEIASFVIFIISLIVSIVSLVIGCNSPDKSINSEDSNKAKLVISRTGTLYVFDSSKNELSDKEITITVSYAAIACGCPQWFETKYNNVDFLEGVERFYLEPVNKSLTNANGLWDGEHLPFILKLTGRFSKEKEIPLTYHLKDEPEKARIFWYDTITVISPSYHKNNRSQL